MGWELRVNRLEEHAHPKGGRKRTYGSYQVFIGGAAVEGLDGFMVEPQGPGDNGPLGKSHKRCVAAGVYPLTVHEGTRYRSVGYKPASSGSKTTPMPGIGVTGTGNREAILIHCTHDPFEPGSEYDRWLSSIGCFNPTGELATPAQLMDFLDSRARTVALIDSLIVSEG